MANGVIDLGLINGDPFSEANLNSLEDYISRGGDYGAGAPSGTPSEGAWWYDTTNKRTYRYVNGAWTTFQYASSYTPTLANLAIGTGGTPTNTCNFTVSNGLILLEGVIKFGTSGTTLPGASVETITMPSGFSLVNTNTASLINSTIAYVDVSAVQTWLGFAAPVTSSTIAFTGQSASLISSITSTFPFTWAVSDEIRYSILARVTG